MTTTESLREKRPLHGFWCVTGNPIIVEAAAVAGPDFVCIDTQHGIDLGRLDPSLFTMMAHYGVPGLVRVVSLDEATIGRALDLGAAGIVVPLVESAEDAARAVHATRHAPRGGRSYGMQTPRVGPFDVQPFVVIQVETAAAVADLDAIAAIEGVDALYIGPADLGLSLVGKPTLDVNSVLDGDHHDDDDMARAFAAVVSAATANSILPGLHCSDGATGYRAVEHGFQMTSVAADVGLIGEGLRRELSIARAGSS